MSAATPAAAVSRGLISASIGRNDLLRGLRSVVGVCERKTTIPILGYVLLRFDGLECHLRATDLDVWTFATVKAEAESSGGVALPARRLVAAVRAMRGPEIEIRQTEPKTLTLSSDGAEFTFHGAEDFPASPEIGTLPCAEIKLSILRLMAQKTVYAMSTEESRFQLNAARLEWTGESAWLCATDGHRLTILKGEANGTAAVLEKKEAQLIPRKALLELMQWNSGATARDAQGHFVARTSPEALDLDGYSRVAVTKHHIRFSWRNQSLIAQLAEGNFPNWRPFMEERNERRLEINREFLMDRIKAVQVMGGDFRRIGMKLQLREGEAALGIEHAEGHAVERFVCNWTGAPNAIAFNHEYILQWLKAAETERVSIGIQAGNSWADCRPVNGILKEDRMIVMPMSI